MRPLIESVPRLMLVMKSWLRGPKVLILGRTDARHELGLGEAINRATKFAELGADVLFIESPQTEEEMIEICRSVSGPKMANIVEGGLTPELKPDVLGEIGYSLAAYPLTLLSASMLAMRDTLRDMKSNRQTRLMDFLELRDRVGFEDYYALLSVILRQSVETYEEVV